MTSSIEPPLKGVRVVELTHTILGPSCGMILADLGAEVIKVEPVDGDRTRKLRGFGGGFFGYFNRNKKSLALDADSPEGRKVLVKLLQSADVMIENFAPGSMAKRGLGPEHLEKINPRLVYCALKGFLPGPYEKRPALDEVVQMMGGLAYMTGPTRPAVARRHLGGRHRGRHVRRLRHGAGAEAARAHRQGRAGRDRAVRIGGVPDGPASRHHGDERRAAAADARAGELVGDLRDLQHRGRPAGLHRHHLGRPVEALLRVLQAGRARGRSQARHQQPAHRGAAVAGAEGRRGLQELHQGRARADVPRRRHLLRAGRAAAGPVRPSASAGQRLAGADHPAGRREDAPAAAAVPDDGLAAAAGQRSAGDRPAQRRGAGARSATTRPGIAALKAAGMLGPK